MPHETAADPTLPSARGAVRNTLAILGGQSAGMLVRTLGTLLLIALLPRDAYGVLTAAIAFVDPIRFLAVLNLDTIAIRQATVAPRDAARIVGTLLRLRLALAGVAFLLAGAAGFLIRGAAPGGGVVIVCAALLLLPQGFQGPFEVAFQARQRMRRIAAVPALAGSVNLLAFVCLWRLDAPIAFYIAAPALGDAVGCAVTWRVLRRDLTEWNKSAELNKSAESNESEVSEVSARETRLAGDASIARAMVRDGLPLAYVGLLTVLYTRIGFYLVEWSHGLGDVADLGVAVKLSMPLLLIGSALSVSAQPYATRLATEGRFDDLRQFFRTTLVRVIGTLLPVAVLAALVAEPMAQWLKPEYTGGALAFRWLVFGALWMLVCQFSSACLIALERYRVIALMTTFNLVLFLALAIPLTPLLSAEGVAVSTFVMELVNAVVQVTIVFCLLGRGVPRLGAGRGA